MTSTPVQPHQRIQYLDVLRGFAITGVLWAYVFWNLGTAPANTYSAFDAFLEEAGSYLVDSKCYTLLASLFAVGFVLHMHKSGSQSKSLYTYRKRLLGLILIGLLHACFLRNGDILVPYAVLMLLVTWLYTSSDIFLILLMIFVFFLAVLLPELWKWMQFPLPQRPVGDSEDSYLKENLAWLQYWYASAIFFWESTLFLLLAGLILGKIFIEKKLKLSRRQLQIIALVGWITGTVSYLVFKKYHNEISALKDIGNTEILRHTTTQLLWLIHSAGMAAAYASIFFLLSKRFSLNILASLGRMSLTNYILQAVIVVPLCIFLHLFDRITPSLALLITAAVWIVQVGFSQWWLKYHQFGPLEWLLRRFTYGKILQKK